jgi:serine/threonine protein kinase
MYRSPEQIEFLLEFPLSEKVDIFALGVILYMLCFGKPPFETKLAAVNS